MRVPSQGFRLRSNGPFCFLCGPQRLSSFFQVRVPPGKAFGFLEFASHAAAKEALYALDGVRWNCPLELSVWRPPPAARG